MGSVGLGCPRGDAALWGALWGRGAGWPRCGSGRAVCFLLVMGRKSSAPQMRNCLLGGLWGGQKGCACGAEAEKCPIRVSPTWAMSPARQRLGKARNAGGEQNPTALPHSTAQPYSSMGCAAEKTPMANPEAMGLGARG